MTEEKKEIDYKAYKWLLSSALQKSLRRGNYELAKSYVDFLWEHDRSYLTYRLGTIITEDVGITNIPLLKKYLDTQLKKEEINNMGGLDFIQEIVKESCESLKDRSSCDAAYFSGYFTFSEEKVKELSAMKSEEEKVSYLRSVVNDKNSFYVDRINAGWVILGNNTFKNEKLPFFSKYLITEKGKNIDNIERFIESFDLPIDFLGVMRNAHLTQKEQIVLGLPIVQYLFNENLALEKENPKIAIGETIEKTYFSEESYHQPHINLNILNSAIDGHTREGKIVFSQYLKMKNAFTDYMNKLGVAYDMRQVILSHCLFRIEGHEVNKRVYFPGAVKMMNDCTQRVLNMKLGFNVNDIPEDHNIPSFQVIKGILLDEIGVINNLREKAIHNMSIPYLEPKKPTIKKNTL